MVLKKPLLRRQMLLFMPLVILVVVIFAYPLLRAVWLSFHEVSYGSGKPAEFLGFANYRSILSSDAFIASAGRTMVWAFMNLVVQLSIPVGIAMLLNKNLKGMVAARALALLPWIVPTVPVAVVTRLVLLPRLGIVSEFFNTIGFGSMHFLGNRATAMPVLVLINSWQFIPFGTLMILSALQTIPTSLYDAAKVDGCNRWKQFQYITFPYIGIMIWFVGFLAFAWNFNTFDLIQLTTQGGPGRVTETLPVMIYRHAFRTFRLGEAAAMATLAGAVMIILGILYFWKMSPKDDFNQ